MKDKIFNILSYILPGIAAVIFLLFLIALVSTFISVVPLQRDLSNDGFKVFFETYSSSIQLGAAFLGVLAITLALERMKQSKEQIDVMADNNKFNNFYKHREEFINYMTNSSFIKKILPYSSEKLKNFLSHYYQYYFYKDYKTFKPAINDKITDILKQYFESLKKSSLNVDKFDSLKLSVEELNQLAELFSQHWQEIYSRLNDYSKKDSKFEEKYISLTVEERNLYHSFTYIILSYLIISIILTFSPSIDHNRNDFDNLIYNYSIYSNKLGLDSFFMHFHGSY